MDAFAVAIVAGLTLRPMTCRHVVRMASSFGVFQALMPLLGWLAGNAVHQHIAAADHWIAFALLGFVGGKMIWGAAAGENHAAMSSDPTSGGTLLVLSVATSIDALAVGLSLAMIGSPIAFPAAVIGIVAAVFTATGMLLGRRIGAFWGRRVEALGGLILLGIGLKILVEHLAGQA
jgi:putative Mn2+ efflux pump MntP